MMLFRSSAAHPPERIFNYPIIHVLHIARKAGVCANGKKCKYPTKGLTLYAQILYYIKERAICMQRGRMRCGPSGPQGVLLLRVSAVQAQALYGT